MGIFLGGGLGGGAGSRSGYWRVFCPASILIVEPDDDEVEDSRTEGSICSSGVLCLAMGGRLWSGLVWRARKVALLESEAPGECEYEDIEVGVEETLKGPGDSEYRVEGVVESTYWGAGGGSISVGPTSRSYVETNGSSASGSTGAKIVEDDGRDMPSTVSENGSLYPPGIAFI